MPPVPDESDDPEPTPSEMPTLLGSSPSLEDGTHAAHAPPPGYATPRTSGGTLQPGAVPLHLQKFGDFEAIAKIGQGGMGAVYRARQISLDRQVALKVLPGDLQDDENYVERFQREATLAAQLNHPHIVRVFSFGEFEGCHFIAMELIEGENLRQRLKRGALDPLEALRICAAVAQGLQHGWQTAQIIHRDIKPANILLTERGEVKVGDLGLAKSLLTNTSGLTQTGAAMGTAHYMSPEQARGEKPLDVRTDIYSLGCTLYEMLTGRPPYEGTDGVSLIHQHLHAPLPAILKVMPSCPLPLARLVGKMLKKQRPERQQSYEELLEQIASVTAFIEGGGVVAGAEQRIAQWREIGSGIPAGKANASSAESAILTYVTLAAILAALGIAGFFIYKVAAKRPAAPPVAAKATPKPPLPAPISTAPAAASSSPEPKSGISSSAASTAIKLWDGPEKIKPTDKIRWQDNAVWLDGHQDLRFEERPSRDAIIRASIRMNPDAVAPQIALRTIGSSTAKTARRYFLALSDSRFVQLQSATSGSLRLVHEWPLPRNYAPDEWARLELRAIGNELTVSIDSQSLGAVQDTSQPQAGGVWIYATANGYFRDIEYIPLDGSTPATATKDAPFMNSLGMKFVPVPITGGPTDGQRVLFSVWETRVQDYEVFVKETGRELVKPDFDQAPTHPAVGVTWEDTTAFCAWLTERERKAGKLGASEVYRLPSDHEWSCAVGIGDREDAAKLPAEKHIKIKEYPWGSQWPPPDDSGNYASEEARPLQEAGQLSFVLKAVLPGYRDGFATTAPVGSYAPGRFGLHDFGGNAREWCLGWFDAAQERRVARGGPWNGYDKWDLQSSGRAGVPPTERRDNIGFRVVLAPAP